MSDDEDIKNHNDLTEAELNTLREKFGIDFDTSNSLAEVEKQFQVTRERIVQIEEKALKKIEAEKNNPKCSFCKKRASEVTRMIRSELTIAHICNECIKVSLEHLDE